MDIRKIRRITVKECGQGIYELLGDPIAMQLIVIKELSKEENYWLQNLRNNLCSGEDFLASREEGIREGMKLAQALVQAGRFADFDKAVENQAYRARLYEEFQIG